MIMVGKSKSIKLFTTKTVLRFAFVPTAIDNDRIVWLQFYYAKYRYEDGTYYEPDDNWLCDGWDVNKYGPRRWTSNSCGSEWVLKSTYLCNEIPIMSKLDNYERRSNTKQ